MGVGYDTWQLYAPEGDSGPGALDAATRQRLALQAAALRRQEQLGTLAAFTGDKVLAPYGQQQLAAAREGADQLTGAPGQRLRQLLQRQQVGAGEEEGAQRALQADPASAASGTARALLKKFMPQTPVAPTASARELLGVLPLAEKAYGVDENARQRALTRQAMAAQASAPLAGYTDDAITAMADQWAASGVKPTFGMGKAAIELGGRVAARMLERHPGVDLAGAKAGYGADTGSLKQLQAQADRVDAFEKTAIANLDQAVAAAKKVVDVGSPWFNKPLRTVQQGLAGSADMQRYITARQVAVQEVAKVLSGAMGNTGVSDSARHEVEKLLGADASMEQILAATEVLKVDMAKRKEAMGEQLRDIRSRVTGSHQGSPPAEAAAASASAGLTPEEQKELESLRAHFGRTK